MKRLFCGVLALTLGSAIASAQSLDDLNIQIHGYATQGFLYTTQNNWNTTSSSEGSPAWSEVVVNLTSVPSPKLRIGAQARYFLLGDYGNALTLDWASGDYKVNEKFGIRVGKVKSPMGLLNESQDIDPAFLWSVLPQSIYPIASRNAILAHYGGVVYGTFRLGDKGGKLDYRAWGGERVIGSDDGYLRVFRDQGISTPQGVSGKTYGGTLRWNTPLSGLMVGESASTTAMSGSVQAELPFGPGGSYVPVTGLLNVPKFTMPYFYARFERNKVMLAGEYNRLPVNASIAFPGLPVQPEREDIRSFYGMASYKLTSKLSGGLYYSSGLDKRSSLGPGRYQKDWAISARFDFSQFLYAKAEQHVIDGEDFGYSSSNNPNGLKPDTRMTILKVGVSF